MPNKKNQSLAESASHTPRHKGLFISSPRVFSKAIESGPYDFVGISLQEGNLHVSICPPGAALTFPPWGE